MIQSKEMLLVLLLIYFGTDSSHSYPIKTAVQAMEYLKAYGYMNTSLAETEPTARLLMVTPPTKNVTAMLMTFQHMVQIKETGVLDERTLEEMNVKRCGCKDIEPGMVSSLVTSGEVGLGQRREKRFVINQAQHKWNPGEVKFQISKYPSDPNLDRSLIDQLVSRAFRMWQVAADDWIYFTNNTNPFDEVHIDILFLSGKHGDQYPFDGPGETLAHAFPPGNGIYGDIHLDDTELWDLDGTNEDGSNFFWVIVHEIGHSLGLSHSTLKNSIMWLQEPTNQLNLQLHSDDINGIRYLYVPGEDTKERKDLVGSSTTSVTTTAPETTKSSVVKPSKPITMEKLIYAKNFQEFCGERPDPCGPRFVINAATTAAHGQQYLFSGCYYIQVNPKGIPREIHRIQTLFRDYPGNTVDAVLTTKTGRTYFFHNGRQWTFVGIQGSFELEAEGWGSRRMLDRLPRMRIDAAFQWQGYTYVVQGRRFLVVERYPRGGSGFISNWGVTDERIDAALVHRHTLYLFRGQHFWKLRETSQGLRVDSTRPRSIQREFLHCQMQ